MKKLFTLIAALVVTGTAFAQTKIAGDMNDDGKLTIEDVTLLTNTLLGKTAQKTISGDGTDQTTLLGSWAAKDAKTITFSSGGKASMNYATVSTYEYYPSNGGLLFFNTAKRLVYAYKVSSVSPTCLSLFNTGSDNLLIYYPVEDYASDIYMYEESVPLFVGEEYQLRIVASPDWARVYNTTWSSSDPSVATVSANGMVTGTGAGTATITAKTADGKAVECEVTVRQPVVSVSFPYSKLTIPKGSNYTLQPIISPANATTQTLKWATSNSSVISVKYGKVTANAAGSAVITATTTDGTNLKATCTVQAVNATPTNLTISKTSAALLPNATLQLSATITPSTASGLSVLWSSSNTDVATVDQTGKVTVKEYPNGTKAIIYAQIAGTSIKKSCTLTIDHEYVDLGLPSGTLWATTNVGATYPEEYGGYYAWGETKAYGEEDKSNTHNYKSKSTYTKTYYDWSTYKWCSGTTEKTLTKYNTMSDYGTVDNKITLDLADDAAYVNWGTNWRMPTYKEMVELKENCTWEWVTINGVNGCKVISKKDTSKYIFLPAAGHRFDSQSEFDEDKCEYLSSSLYVSSALYANISASDDYPYNVLGVIVNKGSFRDNYTKRYRANSIRPVRRQ